MPRLVPEETIAREMQKLKNMGVTISTRSAAGWEDDFAERPMGVIAKEAEEAGITYKEGSN